MAYTRPRILDAFEELLADERFGGMLAIFNRLPGTRGPLYQMRIPFSAYRIPVWPLAERSRAAYDIAEKYDLVGVLEDGDLVLTPKGQDPIPG